MKGFQRGSSSQKIVLLAGDGALSKDADPEAWYQRQLATGDLYRRQFQDPIKRALWELDQIAKSAGIQNY